MKKVDFKKTENYTPKNSKEKRLIEAFASLRNEKDTTSFIRDLLTPVEIEEFSNRLEMARLLLTGESYLDVAKKIGVSTTTVTRVAHWLFKGCGGYQKTLSNLAKK